MGAIRTALASYRANAGKDLLASVVVFLVALPLCMGIAIASGVPPALGLITGMVGGLVVGWIAGAPLQVSGSAAGLTVLVWQLVDTYGLALLGVAVLAAGLLQMAAGALHLGRWFRAVSPAVIHGMLAGIGVLIFASQFHVMLDASPRGNGLENLLSIPEAIVQTLVAGGGSGHQLAALVGMTTIVALLAWNRFRPARLASIPGALVAVVAGTLLVQLAGMSLQMVKVPASLAGSLNMPT
ncbi:MAG: SulP family inorganic anion transporter, partial [Myxococcota bacterium]